MSALPSVKHLREAIAANVASMQNIITAADATGQMSDAQREEFDRLAAETEIQKNQLALANRRDQQIMSLAISNAAQPGSVADLHSRGAFGDEDLPPAQSLIDGHAPPAKPSAHKWVDQHGQQVYMLAKGQRWQDLPRASGAASLDGSLGDCIRAAITGNWRNVSPGIRAAMSEGANTTGGFLVPDELMRRLVDAARARSVIMQAGAQTVPMSSDLLRLARVKTDPTFEVKEENAAFTGSDTTFDALTFTSKTVGTLITCSRELAEDAPNFTQQIEELLAAAFAAKLDNIAINGVASTHLDGILDWTTATGIGETGSVGAIEWADISTAAVGVRLQNFEPTAVVINPDIYGDLSMQATGDGTNSSKGWIPAPRHVENLQYLQTTNIATDSVVVAQFDQFVWAIRQGALIEVSNVAGDAFSKHQLLVKLTWRGDTGAFRREAFHRLVGVTT